MNEKRKKYLQEWRKKNKIKSREYLRKWYKKKKASGTLPYYYQPKGLGPTQTLGREYELIALSLLKGSIDANAIKNNQHWDLEWRKKKIEVKVRKMSAKSKSFTFQWTNEGLVDYYLCFCVYPTKVTKVYFIPKEKVERKSIYFGPKSTKHEKFLLKVL